VKKNSIFHSISNFLFSKANREFLIFLFFCAVASIFWLLMTLNENYEQEIRIPVHYTDVPKSVVMTSAETDTIRVTVSDKGITLLSYLYGDMLKDITIDFKSHTHSNGIGEVPSSELSKKVNGILAASSKLVSIKPERLTFYYNYGDNKRVPVQYRGTVNPEDPYYLSEVAYSPDSVIVYASRQKLDSINLIYTELLNYTDFRDSLNVKARLQKIAGVKTMPDEVSIRFMTDVLSELTISDIPIVGINMPKGKILRTFPAKVSVKFVAGIKTYQTLSKSDFRVVADYNEIVSNPSPKCNIKLEESPSGISKIALSVKQVDYLIEEQFIEGEPEKQEP
jgi:hypothetical protein